MTKIKVITYGRVCTEPQDGNGNDLYNQEKILKEYCDNKNYNIVKHYEDVGSGQSFDRLEWNNLMDYVKNNKNDVDLILISKWSRLSRNIEKTLAVVSKLSEMGVIVNSIEQSLDLTIKDNKFMFIMYLTCGDIILKPNEALRYQNNIINTYKEKQNGE